MQLSVIIVNYNVKHFLAQCLLSVKKASEGLAVEVIVVDNNSVDGSQQMLKDKFLNDIQLIENKGNPGFSKANNQGIVIAKGKYVLLLNPDTVVEENTFKVCIEFMEKHENAGALGVKMIDGKGHFLPESKRALPTPMVSFYKIFGLSALFPQSKTFAKYHLTYLDKNQNHEIEVLSGAFMFMRKSVLEEIGYLDEAFFMYGEDIDLSYRVLLGGYKNYYLADTQIIHYKGESTKKGSLNYVKVFYQAMIIFAKKHFAGGNLRAFLFMIQVGIYVRAAGAVAYRLFQRFGFAFLEGALFYLAIFGIKEYWEHNIKFVEGGEYPLTFDVVAAPIYVVVFVFFLWIMGAYQKPYKIRPIIVATFSAFVSIATVSYLFPYINYSRAIVGLSSIFSVLIALTTRGVINFREKGTFFFTETMKKRVLVVGETQNLARILRFLQNEPEYPIEIVGIVTENNQDKGIGEIERIGEFSQLAEMIRFYGINELIFCNKSLPTERIINLMAELETTHIEYKIVPPDADYIVGSQFIHTARHQRQILPHLNKAEHRFHKRMLDLSISLLLLLLYPITFFLYKKPFSALSALFQILINQAHFVGYIQASPPHLPKLKPAYLSMLHRNHNAQQTVNAEHLDKYYAKAYTWDLDLEIVAKAWRSIGE
ncbi:MAG: glycosyltransferase [Bacteroidia bacterium]